MVNAGDIVDLEVFAKYRNPQTDAQGADALLTVLTNAFQLSSTGATPLDGQQALNAFNGLFQMGPYVGRVEDYEYQESPRAYLNYILFDENFVLQDFGFDQVSTAANQAGEQPVPHELLSLHVKVQEKGYLYIYLSNENRYLGGGNALMDVYFDDFRIVHHTGVEQTNDYYPFGLTFNSYQRENSIEQRWKFQGQEHIDDLGLNWDSFKWRNHQPDIGRFFNIDPLADKYVYNSPYAFSENRVVNAIELEGLEALIVTTRNIAAERTRTATGAQVSSSTIATGLLHPLAAMRVGKVKPGSTNMSSVSGRIGRHMAENGNMSRGDGGEENGFRHALWSASITHEFGSDAALKLTNTHEGIGPFEKVNIDFSKPLVQKTGLADGIVDILNNEIGRDIAGNLPENASALDIAAAVLDVQRNEGLWTVSKDKDGNISISRQKITQQQFEQASERLTTLDNNGFNDADRKSLEEEEKQK